RFVLFLVMRGVLQRTRNNKERRSIAALKKSYSQTTETRKSGEGSPKYTTATSKQARPTTQRSRGESASTRPRQRDTSPAGRAAAGRGSRPSGMRSRPGERHERRS